MYLTFVLAFVAVAVTYLVSLLVIDVLQALSFVRSYYRCNPDAVPPDKFLVRLGLIGIRRRR